MQENSQQTDPVAIDQSDGDVDITEIKAKLLNEFADLLKRPGADATRMLKDIEENISNEEIRTRMAKILSHPSLNDRKTTGIDNLPHVIKRVWLPSRRATNWLKKFLPTTALITAFLWLFGLYSAHKTDLRELARTQDANDQRVTENYISTIKEVKLNKDYEAENDKAENRLIQDLTLVALRELTEGSTRKASIVLLLNKRAIPATYTKNESTKEELASFYSGADLKRTNFEGYKLKKAMLVAADLRGAVLNNATMKGADFRHANLSCDESTKEGIGPWLPLVGNYGPFKETKRTTCSKLIDARLIGSNFSSANLKGADLSKADLSYVDLHDIAWDSETTWPGKIKMACNMPQGLKDQLQGAATIVEPDNIPSGTDLSGQDLSNEDLNGVDLKGIQWNNETTKWPEHDQIKYACNIPDKLKEELNL